MATPIPTSQAAHVRCLIRAEQLREQYLGGISKNTLRRWVDAGKFPRPVELSVRVHAWRVEDVQRWLAERNAALEAA
jgi:predicted DNA-binding transcriptional regulator AlpA